MESELMYKTANDYIGSNIIGNDINTVHSSMFRKEVTNDEYMGHK